MVDVVRCYFDNLSIASMGLFSRRLDMVRQGGEVGRDWRGHLPAHAHLVVHIPAIGCADWNTIKL